MPAVNEISTRSTILLNPDSPHSQSTEKTTMSTSGGGQGAKAASPVTGTQGPAPDSNGESNGRQDGAGQDKSSPAAQDDGGTGNGRDQNGLSPTQIGSTYPQAYSMTPQQQGYYHVGYNAQVTPEPPSPAGPGGNVYTDVGSFFQQPGAFHNSNPFPGGQQYQQQQQAPPSPSQSHAGSIPPASPLFPRITGQATAGLLDQHRMLDGAIQPRGAPLSPGPPYLTSALGPSVGNAGGWGDRNQQLAYQHNSPQMSAQGIPIPYVPGMPPRSANAGGRSYSFEESMLPPSAMQDQQNQQQHDQQNPGYSPYGGANQNSIIGGGAATLFNQQWGYGGPPPDMYNTPGSPLQPRPSQAMGSYPGVGGAPPRHLQHPSQMAAYGGQFYPATSPGPPIQTTTSNKGPDGANLFIFHIPNHFTNLDMYQLFCPYGNLLSVRIMVEKDTGRSRGFGFVSYDSPDAAALAIKELNGFAIGNKRLKVQHKQIRPSDQHNDRNHHGNNNDGYDMGGFGQMPSSLPPSGAMAAMSNSAWYNNNSRAQAQHHGGGGMPDGMDGGGPPRPQELQPQVLPQEEVGGGTLGNTTGVTDGGEGADPSNSPLPSPLSSLDPLRQALPDVSTSAD